MSIEHDTFLPAVDRFGQTAPLSFSATFPVMGVPLIVRSNAEAAISLAARSFGAWTALDPALVARDRTARLDIVVHGPALEGVASDLLTYRRHGDIFMTAGTGLLSTVRLDEQHAVTFISPSGLDAPDWFMAHVNGGGIMAATQRDRVPIHAATVVHDGVAFVIAGASGSGKSTLTCACRDAGFDVLTEDAVFVSLAGTPRLWGHSPRVWIAPDAVRFFAGLAAHPVVTRTNGKRCIAVQLDDTGHPPLLTHAGEVVVLILRRTDGPATLVRAARGEVHHLLTREVDEGFDQYAERRALVVAWLAARPIFHLDGGRDPHAAVDGLREAGRSSRR